MCTKMIKKVMQMNFVSASRGIMYVKGTVFLYQENC